MKKNKILKSLLIPILGTSFVTLISCSPTKEQQSKVITNDSSNKNHSEEKQNNSENQDISNLNNDKIINNNSRGAEEKNSNKASSSDTQNNNSQKNNRGNSSEGYSNSDDETNNESKEDDQNVKKSVLEAYENIINEQKNFINLYNEAKLEKNIMYKYEMLFDSIDKITEDFDRLETPLKFDKQELEKYNKTLNDLKDKFDEITKLKNTLSTHQDTRPEYYAGNFDKNNIKKEESSPKNDYSNYPELEAIKKSTKDGNTNVDPVRSLVNKKALEFIDLAKGNITDFNQNNYTLHQKEELRQFLNETIIKGETNKKNQIRLVFNWITKNVQYARQANQAKLNPYEVKQYLYAVCGGYSILYKAFLDLLGIKTVMVIGWSSAGAHQWNAIQDPETNEWFFSDTTWGVIDQRYFRLSPKEISNDHMVERVLDLDFSNENVIYEYWNGLSVKNALVDNPNILDKLDEIVVENISDTILNNDKVRTLHIPQFVKHIEYPGTKGTYAFDVSKDNKFFASQDGILYSKNFEKILMTPNNLNVKNVVIPKETSTLNDGKELFESSVVESIEVEAGNYSFASFKGVLYNNDFSQIISIPNGLTNLVVHPNVKFQGQEISFKDNIKTVKLNEGITNIVDYTFNTLKKLEYVILPSTIENISEYAFWQVKNITLKTYKHNKYVEDFAKKHSFKYEVIENN
ncbi:leucine-rich repeat protein [Mycoplasma sp. CSL7491-lung]|uniref:transglutaminase domain-containing protein n=1 Tax=Mycoplasma sp. CSL7491-lung TaxID=549718 RepID=UPI001C110D8B|nr:leucine-rich repeat protein [Mycoplasma sp. CSL7491-lung]MBU4693163.1 leucine-rich repeat protein [Mycoplasma sp. CSL7491-lung]